MRFRSNVGFGRFQFPDLWVSDLKKHFIFCADWNLPVNEMVIDERGNSFRKCFDEGHESIEVSFAT